MKKRELSRILAILMILAALLCACTPGDRDDGTQAPVSTAPELPEAPDSGHVDADADGICDDCGQSVIVALDFYAFNDLHGVLCDTLTDPGVDELTTYLKNAYADESAYEIVLSSGDMWQGSVESSSNKGAMMTEWMNDLDFVSMTLGNHEFDWGSSYISANAELAEFPFLAINVRDANTDTPYCQPSVIVERGELKIGIIGAVSNWMSSISGEFTDGLEFITGKELTQLVMAESVRLREQGCHFIVYSIHAGVEDSYSQVADYTRNFAYYDTTLSQGYVDLVFEGHTHCTYVLRDKEGVYHLQSGGYNSGLSFAAVSYNLVTNTYEITEAANLHQDTYADDALADDPIVEALYTKYFTDGDPYVDVLGVNDASRSSSTIGKQVAQLYWDKGVELWGDEYEIVLGGGYIKTRSPYSLYAGDVTYSQLYSLLPFDNSLVLCQVTGQQLRQKMINSSSYYCAYDPSMEIVDDRLYYIVTDTYTSFYKNNMFTEVARLENYYARDLLADFIAADGWGGNAETITIAQANAIGQALGANESTERAYRLTGTVTSVVNATYGNLYIQDENGDSIYIYGLYDPSGYRYDRMDDPPQVGDTITVVGAISNYAGGATPIVEIQNACLQ